MSKQPNPFPVAETTAHARQKMLEQEQAVASMEPGDPRLLEAIELLLCMRRNLATAEFNNAFEE